MKTTWNITELAKEFGLTTRTIRYYETIGLVDPSRKGNTRIYSKRDHVRLKLTVKGKRLGFSLADIKEIIDMYDGTESNSIKQLQHTLVVIERKREELNQQLSDIKAMNEELDLVEERYRTSLENVRRNNSGNNSKSNKSNSAKRNQK